MGPEGDIISSRNTELEIWDCSQGPQKMDRIEQEMPTVDANHICEFRVTHSLLWMGSAIVPTAVGVGAQSPPGKALGTELPPHIVDLVAETYT